MDDMDSRERQAFVAALLELLLRRMRQAESLLSTRQLEPELRRSAEHFLANARRFLLRSRHVQ